MEKERLTIRRGGHHNYVPPKQAVFPEPGSLAYTDNYDRFQGNFAEHEFARRQEEMQHKKVWFRHPPDTAHSDEPPLFAVHRWHCLVAQSNPQRNCVTANVGVVCTGEQRAHRRLSACVVRARRNGYPT